MASVTLPQAEIGLVSDYEATRVQIPRLRGMQRQRQWAGTAVLFEGDEAPTPFRGQQRTRVYPLEAVFTWKMHERMRDLIDLFDRRATMLLRTHVFLVAGLDPVTACVVHDATEEPLGGLNWRVTFTAQQVQWDPAV